MSTKDLEKVVKNNIKIIRKLREEAKQVLNKEREEKKKKKKEKWLREANNFVKKSKEDYHKVVKSLKKSKEFISTDKEKSKKYAQEAKIISNEAIKNLKKVIRLKNKIEGENKKWLKENLTLKNIGLTILFLYTVAVLVILMFFNKILIKTIFDISYKYIGRYEFANFFSIGFFMIMVSFLMVFVIWAIHFFNKKKVRWWFWITIILMFLIGITGFLFVHMAIGQDNLDLKLRNKMMDEVGNINCRGSNDVLLNFDNVVCTTNPQLKNISGNVTFTINKTITIIQNFDNLTFIAPENVEHISFKIEGLNDENELLILSTGNPYHFYTKEEYDELKARFLRYLAAILSLIFITIPLVVYQLKKLYY